MASPLVCASNMSMKVKELMYYYSVYCLFCTKELKNIKIDNPGYDLCGKGILEYDFEKTLKFVTIIHKSYIEILKI